MQAPNRPFLPPGPPPSTVGGGGLNDFSAQVPGLISSATGSFENIAGVMTETGGGTANDYSLQVNTRPFTHALCTGAAAGCQGWQQFIYSAQGFVFMQYWLVGYGTTVACPAGWMTSAPHCYRNSANAASVPTFIPIANLGQLSLTGSVVSGGMDTVTFSNGGASYAISANDNVLNAAGSWREAEFNIFGDGNSTQAVFNAGSRMAVRIAVNDGTTTAPTCTAASFTGETNSLTLVPPCCPYGGASPAVVFWQSSNPGATSMCSGGTSIGDTHLTNFNGLLFDFQASGDFLLAETDAEFVVQTRQKSGAPTWPNASVNKAVAMQIGKTQLGLCLEPTRFIVDGKPTDLGNRQSLSLPDVDVVRNGNTYVFTRIDGANVRAELNNGWINVSVGLGRRTPVARVRGLLGNVNGNTGADDLAARGGAVLSRPISFTDLYQRYGESWRVPDGESLLTKVCGDKPPESGVPDKPFYAQDLDPKVYKRARAICTKAGVKEPKFLDACTLDTAVLGDPSAAKVFVRANPPRAEVRIGPRTER